jgi:hypothetical protein
MIAGLIGLGAFALCCCHPALTAIWLFAFGLTALILGIIAVRQTPAGTGRPEDRNMAIIAIVLGSLEFGLALVAIVTLVLALLSFVTLPLMDEFRRP